MKPASDCAPLIACTRAHAQTKPVTVYRLVTHGTVEERIVQRAEKKLYLDKMVNRGSAVAQPDEAETPSAGEMAGMLRFGAACCFEADGGGPPSDAELEAIIDRTRSEGDSRGAHSVIQYLLSTLTTSP